MVSILYLLNEDLDLLMYKNVKGTTSIYEPFLQFRKMFMLYKTPIIPFNDNWSFLCIKRDSIIIVVLVERIDVFVMQVLHFMEQFYELLKSYLEVKALNKIVIANNSTLILELIDECIDFGIIQVTDAGVLKDYIKIKVNRSLKLETDQYIGKSETIDLESDKKKKKKHGKKGARSNYYSGSDDSDDSDVNDNGKKNSKKKTHPKIIDENNLAIKGKEIEQMTKNMVGALKEDPLSLLDKTKKFALKRKNKSEEVVKDANDEEETFMNSDIAKTTIMAISWRTKGIHYGKNEFFLDVIETIEYLMDFTTNTVRKHLIHGEIYCKCFLSGMPTLRVSINKILNHDEHFLSNCKFHQCVSLDEVNSGDEIKFIPPDGEFSLCKYELKKHIRDEPVIKLINFDVKPKHQKFKLKMSLIIESHFKVTNTTTKLNLKIPMKKLFEQYEIDLSKNIKFRCDVGQILFNISDDFLLWEIDQMKGGHGETQLTMAVEFALFNHVEYETQQEELKHSMNPPPLRLGPKLEELYKQVHDAEESIDNKHPEVKQVSTMIDKDRSLKVTFEIPYLTSSGLKIEYLKIEEPQLQYQSFPWVRYKIVSDPEFTYLVM